MDNQAEEELDELQDELVEETLEKEFESQRMHVDNRSIYTIRDEIIKRAEEHDNKNG